MKTLLGCIKKYPKDFISSANMRATTTPSEYNKTQHLHLVCAIEFEEWDVVADIITTQRYRSALEGVVYCLNSYSNLTHDQVCEIVDVFQDGELV